MSEPLHVTNEYVTDVEEEQNVLSDFWLMDDESDTNSVTAPSDISYVTEDDQAGDGHEESGDNDPEDFLMDNLEMHHQEMQTNEQSQILSGTNAAPLSLEHAQVSDTLNLAPMSPCGYVVVGDNIDKNVRPSFQRDNKSTKSFHHFHSFTTKTRINISTLSDPDSDEQPGAALSSADDYNKLIRDFEVLISRQAKLCVLKFISFTMHTYVL